MNACDVMVFGGANMDIAGRPANALVPRDSNIGSVRLSAGGVGRNIAHNLALLGVKVSLVSAFGDDAQGHTLRESCEEVGVDVSHSLTIPGAASSTYLFVMDETGDMQVAINDMAILEQLTHESLREQVEQLGDARACVVDCNLPQATIAWLVKRADALGVPVFCDPISLAKATRLMGSLPHVHTLKPNRLEAEALTGVRVHDDASLAVATQMLLDAGVTRCFVSLGADGLLARDADGSTRLARLPGRLVNATGAGDAMMAALVWSQLHQLDLPDTALAGLAASAIAIESNDTVNPLMSESALLERMRSGL
jgi:pseudouridine kinase